MQKLKNQNFEKIWNFREKFQNVKNVVGKPCLVRCERYVYILLYLMSKLFPAYQKMPSPL